MKFKRALLLVIGVAAWGWPAASAETNLHESTLAYRQAVGDRMSSEARFYAEKLRLYEFNPHFTKTNVNPPTLRSLGSLETLMYLYSFPGSDVRPLTNAAGVEMFLEPGKLAYVMQKDPFALLRREHGDDPAVINKKLAELTNRLTTNSAYQLATQWLRSVDVDVNALEQKYPPQVAQLFYYDAPVTWKLGETPPPNTPKKLLPIFDVSWGGDPDSTPPVWVQLEGINQSLIHLRMEDTRFSRRPPIVITNRDELLKQPDPPQKKLRPLNALALNPGPDAVQPVGRRSQREWAAIMAMLREVNFLIKQLGLQEPKPLLVRHVNAKVFSPQDHALGYLTSENYEYHFEGEDSAPHKTPSGLKLYQEPGKFIGLIKRHKVGLEYQNEKGHYSEAFFKLAESFDSNAAYQQATQWLASIDFNVQELEKKYQPIITQIDFPAGDGVRRKGPGYEISWGLKGDQDPPVCLAVYGPTRELFYLAIRDTRFLKREAILIP